MELIKDDYKVMLEVFEGPLDLLLYLIKKDEVDIYDIPIGRITDQHILPKGFQRIRYFGLHSNSHYQQIREQLATLLPTSTPSDPRGYRVLPRPQFAQLFLETFGQEPLLCPRCNAPMDWEYLYHPKYGILKEAQLFQDEPPDGRTESQTSGVASGDASQDPLATSVALVQLLLPFM
jgi:hypothetical protein